MTRQRSFKRLVRARMEKTGESYAAARAALLDRARSRRRPRAGADGVGRGDPAPDRARLGGVVRPARRLGRGQAPHREIARWVAEQHGIDGWSAQSVTVSYERARGLRAVGEHADGFAITASKTVAVPVDACTTRSSTSRCASAGCPTAASASAPPRSRSRPASTGATAGPGSWSGFTAKGEARASSTSSTPDSPTPRRPSG